MNQENRIKLMLSVAKERLGQSGGTPPQGGAAEKVPVYGGMEVHADNKIMQHLLEENGFTKCGIIHVEDGTPRIAYQKMSLTLPLRRD